MGINEEPKIADRVRDQAALGAEDGEEIWIRNRRAELGVKLNSVLAELADCERRLDEYDAGVEALNLRAARCWKGRGVM